MQKFRGKLLATPVLRCKKVSKSGPIFRDVVRPAEPESLWIRRRIHITRKAGFQVVRKLEQCMGVAQRALWETGEALLNPRLALKSIEEAGVDGGREMSIGNNGGLSPTHSVGYARARSHVRPGQPAYFMEQEGTPITASMLYSLLEQCTKNRDIQTGMVAHALMANHGMETNVSLLNQLIRMFTACGSLAGANQTFKKMASPDVFAWAAIISAHAKLGKCEQAIELYHQMLEKGATPNDYVYVAVLGACASIRAQAEGRQIHAHIVQTGLGSNLYVGNTLINMYAKCGSIGDARRVFDRLSSKNVVSWSTMIAGCALHGLGHEALDLYEQMQHRGIVPDKVILVNILKACTGIVDIKQGKQIHSVILKHGFQSDAFIGSTLVNMFSKYGSLVEARSAFDAIAPKDLVSWNTMIDGYAQHEYAEDALELFWQMQLEGTNPDKATFVSILKACSSTAAMEQGQLIHVSIQGGVGVDSVTGSILIEMYSNCGSLEAAREVYDRLSTTADQVASTAMMAAYGRQGHGEQALELFQQMQLEGRQPDAVTLVSILKVCARLLALEQGKLMHVHVLGQLGSSLDSSTLGTALIDMYTSCGSMVDASRVFNELSKRDLASWTSIITGYAQNGDSEYALQLYSAMQQQGVEPSRTTLISVLQACSSTAALGQGKRIHAQVVELGLETDLSVGNSVIHMYAKCGSIGDAERALGRLPRKDLVSWNTLLTAYAQAGQAQTALWAFQQMQQGGIRPDRITFLCLLGACSHAGSVDQGIGLFQAMSADFGITPGMDHCACLVDILGRAGQLRAAEAFIRSMPKRPDAVVWMCLLGACHAHGDVELGRVSFEAIVEREPKTTSAYVLMSSMYASAGMGDANLEIRGRMQRAGAKKTPGRSWMELEDQVHTFMAEDKEHPARKQIYATLDKVRIHTLLGSIMYDLTRK